ncbi:hypothetical protein V6Z11_D01G105700 [Gossypium hirsutum]
MFEINKISTKIINVQVSKFIAFLIRINYEHHHLAFLRRKDSPTSMAYFTEPEKIGYFHTQPYCNLHLHTVMKSPFSPSFKETQISLVSFCQTFHMHNPGTRKSRQTSFAKTTNIFNNNCSDLLKAQTFK